MRNCRDFCKNGQHCTGLIASDGATFWFTPIRDEKELEEVREITGL